MDNAENESEQFISAAEFFQQQGELLGSKHAPDAALRRPPRESLLVVARNSQVKHKISAFDKGGPGGRGGGTAGPHRGPSLQAGRPGCPGGGGLKPSVGLGRRAGGLHPLGAIAEEAAGVAAASLPSRRHAAVVSTAGAPARRHAEAAAVAAPAPVALLSPATQQQVAERQHEACFPSILFQPPKVEPPPREPLPGAALPVPPPLVAPAVHPHPLPSVLAPALRSSLSPPAASTQPAAAPPRHQALAALLAAEAAAAVGAADSDDEHFVDADSGSGSGPPSNENSAAWADLKDVLEPAGGGRVVLEGGGGDDAASVASDASTVAREPSRAAGDGGSAGAALQLPASLQLPGAPNSHACAAPEPERCESPLLADGAGAWAQRAQQRRSLGASAASELFQSAASQLPALDGSSEGPLFGGLPPRRSSLSPAASSASRGSSLATPPAPPAQLLSSSLGATARPEEPPAVAPAAAAVTVPSAPCPAAGPDPAAVAGASLAAGPPLAPEGSLGSVSSRGLAAEASRASLASSSLTAAPSLRIEFAEASLRYSMEPAPHSPHSQHSRTPSGLEAEPQGAALAAATLPQPEPTAEVHPPTALAAVTEAIQRATACGGGNAALAAALQHAPPARGGPVAQPGTAACSGTASATASENQNQGEAPSPAPATPYAATEYDGDDVVMADLDAGFTPVRTAGRRLPPGGSRFQAEAVAWQERTPAGHAPSASPSAVAQPQSDGGAVAETAAAELPMPSLQQAASPETAAGTRPVATTGCNEEAQPAAAQQERPASGAAAAAPAAAQHAAPPQHGDATVARAPAPLPQLETRALHGRSGRLSMPSGWQPAGGGAHRARGSRLSLPSGLAAGVAGDEPAFAARPRLAVSPAPAAADRSAAGSLPGAAEEELDGQEAAEATQRQQQQQRPHVQEVQEAEAVDSPFEMRSRLHAQDSELPAELALQGQGQAAFDASGEAAAADVQPQSAAHRQSTTPQLAEAAQEELRGGGVGQTLEGAGASTMFAAPEAAELSAASPAPAAETLPTGSGEHAAGSQPGDSAAFESRPRLAVSPAVSGTSAGHSAASRPDVPAGTAAEEASADSADCRPPAHRLSLGAAAAASTPAAGDCVEEAGRLTSQTRPGRQQQQEQGQSQQPAPARQPEEAAERGQGAWSSNPLAAAGATPAGSSAGRRFSHSPAPSGLSVGAVSNNPMYAGTPSHPTPPSVNLKSFAGRASVAGTPASAGTSGSTPASVGMQLAEKMHQVAEQLQAPAAPQGLAALATPGAARLAAAATPGSSRFQFAADVEAIFQALESRTPAVALGPHNTLSRPSAAAATAQRLRVPRHSIAAGPNTLLDLESFDANGDTQGGPTPLLRQQLLGTTPAAAALASGDGRRRSVGAPLAATPEEVRAMRAEISSLRTQLSEAQAAREEAVALLGGYQGSIRELQDQQSALVVKLRGQLAAAKAEGEAAQRGQAQVDSQFRTLYADKYQPLKAEAAALRQEVAALQKRLATEEVRAHKAASETVAAQQELSAAQDQARAAEAAVAEAAAAAAAARDAEARAVQQLTGEQRRAEKAAAAKEAELGDLRARHAALTKQYDEAVHRINLAKQARERAHLEAQRKEEEVVALEVRLKEYEGALRDYKKENGRFFESKERYKATIAGLEREVQAKEREKKQLLDMCNELMTRLEREGLAA